ncbi:MAG: DUF3788 domain-containing protein [Flavobacterium sp.]|nr:MAG: DUF3788 domain-containing protein [Flavobacterium sp.]
MKSVFENKDTEPTFDDLKTALGDTFTLWQTVAAFSFSIFPDATKGWHFGGEKFGWSYRIKDSKRVLVYLLPRNGFFKVALVFGQKAFDTILASDVSEAIKAELIAAKPYAEGRGIRIEVREKTVIGDIEKLICLKK